MAPRSQTFSQGGIRSSDWFSDRLKETVKLSGYTLEPLSTALYRDTCSERCTSQWWRARTAPLSSGRATRTRGSPGPQTRGCLGRTGGSGSAGKGGQEVGSEWRQWVRMKTSEEGRLTSWYKVTWGPSSESVNHQAAAPTVAAPT